MTADEINPTVPAAAPETGSPPDEPLGISDALAGVAPRAPSDWAVTELGTIPELAGSDAAADTTTAGVDAAATAHGMGVPPGSSSPAPTTVPPRVPARVGGNAGAPASPAHTALKHLSISDAWKNIQFPDRRLKVNAILTIRPPLATVDALARVGLKAVSDRADADLKKAMDILEPSSSSGGASAPADPPKGPTSEAPVLDVKSEPGSAFRTWLAAKGFCSYVEKVTRRIDSRQDLSTAQRLVLSAGYAAVLAKLLSSKKGDGPGADRQMAKLLGDDAGVAVEVLDAVTREDGLLDTFAKAVVAKVLGDNHIQLNDDQGRRVVAEVRSALD